MDGTEGLEEEYYLRNLHNPLSSLDLIELDKLALKGYKLACKYTCLSPPKNSGCFFWNMSPELPKEITSTAFPQTPELLRNHEAFLTSFIARIVAGNETFRRQFDQKRVRPELRKPATTPLENSAIRNRITSFAQLSEHIVGDYIADDVRNGLGRQVFRAVDSLDLRSVTISPKVMQKYDYWMERTFREDRVRRYRLEVSREKAGNA